MTNLKIRKKKIKDLIPLIKITKDSFPSPIRHIPYLLFFMLVAEENSKVAGFIVLLTKSKMGEIALMAIDKNYRGQNISSKLLTEAFGYLKLKGKKYCMSKVRINNPKALKFYKKNGFQVKKIKKRPILGDVYLIEKKLL